MSQDNRTRLKQWLASGEIRLQPLSFPQRELWEATPMPPADVSNTICALIQVRGLLTPQGSEAALQKVVDRQEVLRLSFLPGKDQPMQMMRNNGTTALRFHELSFAQRQPEAIEELAREIASQPFNLVQGPLYRAEVYSRSPDDHVLVLVIHHAIADGWTLGVFVQDLFASYMQGLRGNHASLLPVPLTYSQWGAAERAYWQPEQLVPKLEFWQTHLAGASRLWNTAASGGLERCVTQISAELGRAIRELARRNGATLFSTLLTAFQITLAEWTGAADIVVGTPVANRSTQAVRETMGYCSGIVPLRGQIDRKRSFAESLRTVHQTTVESFANAMPFAELVRAMGAPPPPGHNPLFEVRFALQNHPIPDVAVPGLSLQLRMRSTGTGRFNLACEINEEGDAMEIAWLFRPNQFPLADIQHVGGMYLTVLAGVCHSPEILTATLMNTL